MTMGNKTCDKCGCSDHGHLHQGGYQVNAIAPDSTRDKTGKINFQTWAKDVKDDSKIDRTKLKGEKDG